MAQGIALRVDFRVLFFRASFFMGCSWESGRGPR